MMRLNNIFYMLVLCMCLISNPISPIPKVLSPSLVSAKDIARSQTSLTPKIPSNAIWVKAISNVNWPNGTKKRPFPTIGAALKAANPGNTIVVTSGIYREAIRLPSGRPKQLITLMSAPGDRVIISGMKKLKGWKRYKGNIYVTSINWRPERLYVNYKPQSIAREPNEGWWTAASVKGMELFDPEHLSNLKKNIIGGEVYIWTRHGNAFFSVPITEFDKAKGRLKVIRKSEWMNMNKGDKYFLKNHFSLIDRPGEWSAKEKNGKYHIYFWPQNKKDLSAVEAPKITGQVVSIYKANHLRLWGLEICGGVGNGLEISNAKDVEIKSCIFHNNGFRGIFVRESNNICIMNNVSWWNRFGISITYANDVVIEMNDIGFNSDDGLRVSWKSENIIVKHNYMHDHLLWGHPDNIQVFRGVRNIKFIKNLILTGGQSIMLEETTNGELRGNMIIGSNANMLIFGHNNAGDYKIHKNTLAFTGYGCMNMTWKGYDVRENIFVTGHIGPMYSVLGIEDYKADRNLFWNAKGLKQKSVLISSRRRDKTLKVLQKVTGQDKNSVYSDPKFINAPAAFRVLDGDRLHLCSRNKFYLRKGTTGFKKGDNVEINFDGNIRRIISIDRNTITIDPGLPQKPTKGWLVANWGNNTNYKLDLRLRKDSPAFKLGRNGRSIGSTLDIQAFTRRDFNGDRKRDVPVIPKELHR
ncbi:MAG: right-handed parallel beta-helix repeat-containing protein [Spirochaetota bacterium]|nr:right-handed parallel beta-helix repeat-containing protein [Spirochaetota bacterium]